MRVSRSIRDLAYKSMQAREALQQKGGREPHIAEIAEYVGAAPENVAMALESVVEPASLYEPAYSDGEDSVAIMDQVNEGSSEESWISDIMFRDTVRALTPAGKKDHLAAVSGRQNPDAGRQRDRHQPGTGQPAGEKCSAPHQRGDLGRVRPGGSASAQKTGRPRGISPRPACAFYCTGLLASVSLREVSPA